MSTSKKKKPLWQKMLMIGYTLSDRKKKIDQANRKALGIK